MASSSAAGTTPFPSAVALNDPANSIIPNAVTTAYQPPAYLRGRRPPYALRPDDQAVLEEQLLELPHCNPLYQGDVSMRSYQLNVGKETIPSSLKYDSNYQDEVQCTVAGLTDVETQYLHYKLRKWITSVQKLGSGAYGVAYSVLVNQYPWFAMKTVLQKEK